MITLEQAKNLSHGDILYHVTNRNADFTPQRWRVSGKPKTWKTRPNEVKVPVKFGLYGNDYVTEESLHLVCMTEAEAMMDFRDAVMACTDAVSKAKAMAPAEYYSDLKKILKAIDMLQIKMNQ